MSKDILNLQPDRLWSHFYSLTQIPRPSKKEEKIREFIINFGKNLGLETIVDEVGNVIIRKPATPGMENRKGVVLQGHLDMVPQKNSDKVHDFENDPIDAYVDGEWVKARGTTLGADNGMGVAAAMAVLESKDISHGPVEALFTTDEETGMTGAVLQMTAHGFIAAAMFLLVGLLYEKTHTRNIQDYSSLVQAMPRFALFTTLTLFAAMGMPGTVGFIAELHTLIGGIQLWGGWMALFALGILLSASYAIRTVGLLFTGPVKTKMLQVSDLTLSEMLTAGVLVGGIVLLGLMPEPLISLSRATVSHLYSLVLVSP